MPTHPLATPEEILAVGRILSTLGLVTAFGHVSQRISANQYQITALGDLAEIDRTITVDLAATTLPEGAPGESWLHTAVYLARPEVGAVVRAQPESAFAVASVTDLLPLIHGQACWLGEPVKVFAEPRLLRSLPLAEKAAKCLGSSGSMLLRANGAVTVGADPKVATARMWLLSTACEVWLRARTAGDPIELSAQDIAAWAATESPMLDRLWRHLARRSGIFA